MIVAGVLIPVVKLNSYLARHCYRFLYYDIGACGRNSDGGLWSRSKLRKLLESQKQRRKHGIPSPRKLSKASNLNVNTLTFTLLTCSVYEIMINILKSSRSIGNRN
jgi:hypothetical protein